VTPKFTVLELPMYGAIDLNDAGDVVGYRLREPADSGIEPVVWLAGGTVEVLGCSTLPVYCRLVPVAMNNPRTVIGRNWGVSYMQWEGFRWHVGDAVVYPVTIHSPMNIEDINDAGQIVGGGPGPGATLISDGTSLLLFGTQGSYSMASAINNAGHITGYVVPGSDQVRHVFLYADGTVRDLGTMSGVSSDAQDINMTDEIVGSAGGRAFLYANSAFTDLGTLGGASSSATGINDAGQIVGTSSLAGADPHAERAFWYVDGAIHDLNGLAAPLSAPLTEARKVNNRGQIIANACAPPGYYSDCRAYLLTPVSSP
jgi:probable HAF family extracellular repeat protein